MKLKFIIGVVGILSACGFTNAPSLDTTQEEQDNNWVIGPFHRPEGVNPVISPQPTEFYCPMRKQQVKWEESDTFNPAATTKDGKIVVLYRAEDNSAQGIGKRTSRVGYAESKDGIEMKRMASPVLFPAEDNFKDQDWPGGCEDPRVAMTEDGLYVMLYTAWNRKKARLAVATSRDLKNWTKHGLAFDKAYNGRFNNLFCKSGSILTKLKGNQLVIDKVDGKYLMYWGEYAVYAATSDNLIDWYPVLDEKNELMKIIQPRKVHFDSLLTECGPPAVRTKHGIVLMYNGKNSGKTGDADYPANAYCAGQLLLDGDDPYKVLDRLDKPFFAPEASFGRVKLLPEALELIAKYEDGARDTLFPLLSTNRVRIDLITIFKLAETSNTYSYHSGRHSFAILITL